jgi:hypothetical protein
VGRIKTPALQEDRFLGAGLLEQLVSVRPVNKFLYLKSSGRRTVASRRLSGGKPLFTSPRSTRRKQTIIFTLHLTLNTKYVNFFVKTNQMFGLHKRVSCSLTILLVHVSCMWSNEI